MTAPHVMMIEDVTIFIDPGIRRDSRPLHTGEEGPPDASEEAEAVGATDDADKAAADLAAAAVAKALSAEEAAAVDVE